MAPTDEVIEEKKARNESARNQITELKRRIAQAEAEKNNEVRADDLDREYAQQDAEIARLTAIAKGLNVDAGKDEKKDEAKSRTNSTAGNQRTPTNFSGGAAAEVKE